MFFINLKENLRLNSPVFRNQRNCSRDVEVDGELK